MNAMVKYIAQLSGSNRNSYLRLRSSVIIQLSMMIQLLTLLIPLSYIAMIEDKHRQLSDIMLMRYIPFWPRYRLNIVIRLVIKNGRKVNIRYIIGN